MPGRSARSREEPVVLLLCDNGQAHAPNVLEHIRALQRFSRHRVDVFNPLGRRRSRLLRLEDYEVVVLHYSIYVLSDDHLSPWFVEQLSRFGGLKVQFIQDEYRRVDAMTERMRELGVGVVFSSVPADAVPDVYGSRLPGVDVLPTLTGYVPAELERRPRPPLAGRPVDVAYRGRSVPYWLGRLGQDKVLIGREFLARAASTGLRCDIAWAEADRIYGDAWYRFLRSSRATLGTESGASIVDFDGSLQERTDEYLRAHPGATFDEVEREILAPYEGNAVIEAISPRVFEAAALGTAMINFTGRYSDVIEPWTHYLPLEKDFSNFDDVVTAVQDDAMLERIAARAYDDLVASEGFSLRRFVEDFDREVEARIRPLEHRPRARALRVASRRLIVLESVAAPERWAELPLVASARERAVARTGRNLLRRFPEIAALAASAQSSSQRERLEHDLVRLAAAAAAHVRELRYLGRPFDVRLELSGDERRLVLVSESQPSQDPAARVRLRDRVAPAICEGRLEEIVWNHSALGGYLMFPAPFARSAPIVIGYHLVNGAHRFTSLAELARREPEQVVEALAPLFRPRPDAPVHELSGPYGALLRLVSAPGHVTARGAAALRAAVGSKELRRLLRAYLGSPEARAETPLDALLKDFFRLRLVSESRAALELDGDGKTLIYRASPNGAANPVALDAASVRSLERIVWDDSGVGGAHDFQALTVLARRFPELAAPALRRAATAG